MITERRASRFYAALAAGTLAILLNSAVLASADLVHLPTAHGGLLRLLVVLTGGIIHPPTDSVFQFGFHIGVGLLMTMFYVYALDRRLPGSPWMRGLIYALLVWLANAAIVLPILGEGFAGSRDLTIAGIVWFACAHTLFFVAAALLYDTFTRQELGVSSRQS
jgi:hypothetical protein